MHRPAFSHLWKFCAPLALGFCLAANTNSDDIDANKNPNWISVKKAALPVADLAAFGDPAVLRPTGVWRLNAEHERFGGFSAILTLGDKLLLISDGGLMMRFDPNSDASDAEALPLPSACVGTGGHVGDSESVAKTYDGKSILIGMERSNMICSFEWQKPESARLVAPSALATWPRNRGAEAMTTLPGAGTAILGEPDLDKDGSRPLLWYRGDPSIAETPLVSMRYLPPKGYKPAEAAFLPDGRMLVLNRRYRIEAGRASVLSLVPAFTPVEGATVTGSDIARIAGNHLAVNFEGMAVVPHAGGATVWLVSDDNFDSSSGTVLMRLEWSDEQSNGASR